MYLIFLKNIASLIVFQECGILFFLHFLCCYAILITAMKPAKSAGCAAGVSPICNTPRSYRASPPIPGVK